jgi:hypothetical protein
MPRVVKRNKFLLHILRHRRLQRRLQRGPLRPSKLNNHILKPKLLDNLLIAVMQQRHIVRCSTIDITNVEICVEFYQKGYHSTVAVFGGEVERSLAVGITLIFAIPKVLRILQDNPRQLIVPDIDGNV